MSAQFRTSGGEWGHVQIAGMVRQIKWDDLQPDQYDLAGSATGWGVNLSSNIKIKKDVLRLQAVYGEGIQNYMNDAPVDVGIQNNFSQRHDAGHWARRCRSWAWWLSTTGPGAQVVEHPRRLAGRYRPTPTARRPTPTRRGQYGLVNLLYYPVPGVMMGAELQYGRRDNNSDGWFEDDIRVQFSFKYNFKHSIGGN